MLGLAIFWQSRRHSRLDLARSLGWLGAFGLIHGIHEWGSIFIPIQATYLSPAWVDVLLMAQVFLLALSFFCLFQFGTVLLSSLVPRLRWTQTVPGALLLIWMTAFLWESQVSLWAPKQLVLYANVWARYLLGFPGALVAALALWKQAHLSVQVPGYQRIARNFEIASIGLLAYAVLTGLLGPAAPFFPANTVNAQTVVNLLGIPVEVLRSTAGLVLLIAIVRGLLVFDVEVDRQIEEMELAQILITERQRISRELHDGAIQTVYTAGLIVESVRKRMQDEDPLAPRIDRVVLALQQAVRDLRQFIVALEPASEGANLVIELRKLAEDPYLQSLAEVNIAVLLDDGELLSPARSAHVIAIVNEALSNVARHAQARHVWITAERHNGYLNLAVIDDGVGFSPGDEPAGFGLRNMRDRARMLGGTLLIDPRESARHCCACGGSLGGSIMKKLHVLLVDDHEVVRLGLATLLEDLTDVLVVGEAGLGREAIALCEHLRPDLVLLDIRLPDMSGVEVCRQICAVCPDTQVVILTSYADDDLITEAIMAGASGYVLKQVGSQELLRAVAAARRGEAMLDPKVTQRVLQQFRRSEHQARGSVFQSLSTREMEVLELVSQGKSNRQIADALTISERTVSNHVSGLLGKLELSNRIELATYAVKNHISIFLSSQD